MLLQSYSCFVSDAGLEKEGTHTVYRLPFPSFARIWCVVWPSVLVCCFSVVSSELPFVSSELVVLSGTPNLWRMRAAKAVQE